jgi:glycosyl transferase, family 25
MLEVHCLTDLTNPPHDTNTSLGAGYQSVVVITPGGRGKILVSIADKLVRHESSGRIGSLHIDGNQFKITWDQSLSETYFLTRGILVHEKMAIASSDKDRASIVDIEVDIEPEVYVISLLRTPERRAIFSALNEGLRYNFFDAVDGNAVEPARLIASDLIAGPLNYTKGAIGAALSHLALWERSIESKLPLTILEDDGVIRRDFSSMSRSVLQTLPPEWDLVMWGWNLDSIAIVDPMPGTTPLVIHSDQNSLRAGIGRFRTVTSKVSLLPLNRCFGSCGYTISPSGARKFRNGCFPLTSIKVDFPFINRSIENNGIDIMMNRLYPLTHSFLSVPPMIISPNFNQDSLTLNQ